MIDQKKMRWDIKDGGDRIDEDAMLTPEIARNRRKIDR